MSRLRAGALNRRCRIEYKSVTQDPHFNTDIPVWVPLATLWCELQDILPSRSEAVKNGVELAANQTRVRMRYRTDITSSMRLVALQPVETVYQIIAGPAIIGNREGLELVVEKYSS